MRKGILITAVSVISSLLYSESLKEPVNYQIQNKPPIIRPLPIPEPFSSMPKAVEEPQEYSLEQLFNKNSELIRKTYDSLINYELKDYGKVIESLENLITEITDEELTADNYDNLMYDCYSLFNPIVFEKAGIDGFDDPYFENKKYEYFSRLKDKALPYLLAYHIFYAESDLKPIEEAVREHK